MYDYTEKVKDHLLNPRNIGEVENPDGMAQVVSVACGDALRLTFKVDASRRIVEAKCKVAGCVSSIAAASALTEILEGMTIEEAEQVTAEDIALYLDGLPPGKTHGAAMSQDALEKAIEHYRATSPA